MDGEFGPVTEKATKAFQRRAGLHSDGLVGSQTYAAAADAGLSIAEATDSELWPPPPANLVPYRNNTERARAFGKFAFEAKPTRANPECIVIDPAWVKANIVRLKCPVAGPILPKFISIHTKVAADFEALLIDWRDAKLLKHVLMWNGSFVPRFIRGSQKNLSNHSWGTAFDINAGYNPLGAIPALKGHEGSVRELVASANERNFYWGGHFSRMDGMHFEAARRIS